MLTTLDVCAKPHDPLRHAPPHHKDHAALSLWRLTQSFGAAIAARGRRALTDQIYASPFWGQTLGGPAPDRFLLHPKSLLIKSPSEGEALMAGRYQFRGGTVETQDNTPFFAMPPNEAWAEDLHSFGWLRHLEAQGSDQARRRARHAVEHWLRAFAAYHPIAWRPHVMGRRILTWLTHGRFLTAESDVLYKSRLLWSLARQARHLTRTAASAPDGMPRLTALTAVVMSGLCLPDGEARVARGQHGLNLELGRQILPDGCHFSRNPEAVARALADLIALCEAYRARQFAVPIPLRRALDRLFPALRFFLHGDQRLALFNGSSEGPDGWATQLLSYDDAQGKPFAHTPHGGFHRFEAGQSLLILDAGVPPPPSVSREAHAGCLSFELSHGLERIIVNCGSAPKRDPEWELAMRATAAHSTVTVADTSSGLLMKRGLARSMIGARLFPGPTHVDNKRQEQAEGLGVALGHDGYLRSLGVRHERRIFMSADGRDLRGEDILAAPSRPKSAAGVKFAVRFHLHPDVKVSLTSDLQAALLSLPSGRSFKFRASGGALQLAESVYVPQGAAARRSQQIVLASEIAGGPVLVKWGLKIEGDAEA